VPNTSFGIPWIPHPGAAAVPSTTPTVEPHFLNTAQAAEFLGVSVETILHYCRSPDSAFPHVRLTPKTYRFDPEQLRAWVAPRRWRGRIQAGARPAAPPVPPPAPAPASKEGGKA